MIDPRTEAAKENPLPVATALKNADAVGKRRGARSATIGETVEELHNSLSEYIESTYHVGHPALVAERRALLREPGVISQRPFFESTPRYRKEGRFSDIPDLPRPVLDLFASISAEKKAESDPSRLIFDPPYEHQLRAVETALVGTQSETGLSQHDLIVMTGTGSGKTEAFLLPILGKLVCEAAANAKAFASQPAVRALVLYPMNALVNDQLGRLRLLFADSRVTGAFTKLAGRPPRFARYTSRTLYPGVRSSERDQMRLRPINDYYVEKLNRLPQEARLIGELQARGKWPAKTDLGAWYGAPKSRWQAKDGTFLRCNTLPGDSELLTRHEVHAAPPDVLITNYSMLEYMLMRPLERPVFDRTRDWLHANPSERFLLVLDEAHLYRGASGTEVAMLIRRLRTRLQIPPDRLQVICTSASFSDSTLAARFGSELTGKPQEGFRVVTGSLDLRSPDAQGTLEDAVLLASLDLEAYHDATTPAERALQVAPLFAHRGLKESACAPSAVGSMDQLDSLIHAALKAFGPMNRLINLTMRQAWALPDLEAELFPSVDKVVAARATSALMTLGSAARPSRSEPGLLPCRIHAFFRGLPGLWACMDPECSEVPEEFRGDTPRPCGKLYAQPRHRCGCGAQVLEFFTCRHCGAAYARGYTDCLDDPRFLWPEGGETFRDDAGAVSTLFPIDILLEAPRNEVEHAEYDVVTGRVNAMAGIRTRAIALKKDRIVSAGRENDDDDDDDDDDHAASHSNPVELGLFIPCGVCGRRAGYGRSAVQDHQTKGDQPFHALVSRQIQVQPPGPQQATSLAPHRGRKVLVFSDSRQTAARLAPKLQEMSMKDVVRPLMVAGMARLQGVAHVGPTVCLDDLYAAVLVAAQELGVRLRPELALGESFDVERRVSAEVATGALSDAWRTSAVLKDVAASPPPQALFKSVFEVLTDPFTGLTPLALGTVHELEPCRSAITCLPALCAWIDTPEQKLALCRTWIAEWLDGKLMLSGTPLQWVGTKVKTTSGRFKRIKRLLASEKGAQAAFNRDWLPTLLAQFCERVGGTAAQGKYRLRGARVTLALGGDWEYCTSCRGVQRPWPMLTRCRYCASEAVRSLDPQRDTVFSARKGYYRRPALEALSGVSPMALIAAEHTAQIGTAQARQIYSKAEENELLFQDVPLDPDDLGRERPAIDVLSCTTTMEVGIDIGALSGVALRNMPPSRANYQQRAGRAGRRGNAIATVVALASADSHDEHYFARPAEMVTGRVLDPSLNLDNEDIARRHVTAYLLQRYHNAKLPSIAPMDQPALFEVLGTVDAFREASSVLNRDDLEGWLAENEATLASELDGWLPSELSAPARQRLMDGLVAQTMAAIDAALRGSATTGDDDDGVADAFPGDMTGGEDAKS